MKSGIFVVAGMIASGKTTLTQTISLVVNCPAVRFSALLNEVARERELPPSREILQALGAEWVQTDPTGMCRQLLRMVDWRPGDTLVVDGMRHVVVNDALRELIRPQRLWLIYVEADPGMRLGRFLAEHGASQEGMERFQHWAAHSVESDIANLKGRADIVVRNEGTRGQAIRSLSDWLLE